MAYNVSQRTPGLLRFQICCNGNTMDMHTHTHIHTQEVGHTHNGHIHTHTQEVGHCREAGIWENDLFPIFIIYPATLPR